MAVRALLVVALFVSLYGCGQAGSQNGHATKKDAASPKNTAEVDLKPANGTGTKGTATFTKAKGSSGVKVVLKVRELPGSGTMYLAHIHPGTCAEEEGGGGEHGHSHHQEHGASEEIEYPSRL
jgi:hypothetical protein